MTADAIADGPVPDDAEELEEPREHTRLGQYRLVQRIGEGGMGVVHLALDRHGRAVALKVLRPHIALDPDARTRLAREVTSLTRVSSPYVAPIIDADVEGPRPYIVTRYVPGPSLDEQVADRGLLPPAELHRVAHGLAEALDAIHGAGVIHRDVKPANVLLVDGEPVLIDFGIAHVADDVRLTMAGLVMGTPGYLAPEVISGQDVTAATDWWGWAATTAFAAGGVPPFGRGAMSAVLARVAQGEPDLRAVDPRIEPLLYAALAPDPAQRPHHHEVVAALESYAHGAPATAAIEVRRVRPQTQVLAIAPTSVMQPAPPAAPAPAPVPPRPPAAPVLAPPPPQWASAPVPAPPPRQWAPAPVPAPVPAPMQPQPGYRQHLPAPAPVPGQVAGPVPESESDWDAARQGLGPYADPRIGRPSRAGTLLALLALLGAVSAAAPVVAAMALLGWIALARTADRSVTSLVMRRHERGARGSDVAVAVASSPWHLVVGTLGALLTAVLPLFVGLCALFATALVLGVATGADVSTGQTVPLVAGGVFAGLTAWWGPGGASLRRGSRSIVRGISPGETMRQVVAAVLLVAAAGILAVTVTGDGATWWPRTTAPSWVDTAVPAP
ncbi:serine/threonine-protein kinase [Ornithinibacter sp.]|uniref:serine/threonine-protein kinase n=1 Tax=Ornithinibacter sp. TaxID=2862748 RepID=UPI002B7434D2|nr:serine/threonine-protein kinase [Ornithinibacter sp.]HRA27342.1 serine/threonine-protein kinase [Ornithinibacter sp.]